MDKIKELQDQGVRLGDITILYRAHYVTRAVEEALLKGQVPYTLYSGVQFYNRKEVKDHGDTGILLGSKLKDGDRVVIIEDVTTSGKSIEETFPIIRAAADVEIRGLMVSLNRMERGQTDKSALEEIREKYGFETGAIVNMKEVVEYLYHKPCQGKIYIDDEIRKALEVYYGQYGAD